MQAARIFLVEDDGVWRRQARRWLEERGHEVLLEAVDLASALAEVPRLTALRVNVAILDGNLTEKDYSGNDGARIASAIRMSHSNIKVICWSNSASRYGWGDVAVTKTGRLPGGHDPLTDAVQLL
jgi:CheY-like chemotaxis protein